ncbi:MAG: preprotein translocase subunit SecY [Planctomycetes bacterium]|nr:preprotein translocase subunit SecY [Planctomycetota bacterium]
MSVSIANLFKVKEIRTRLLITLSLLLCYRIGFYVPLPGVDFQKMVAQAGTSGEGWGKLIGIMNVLTGARLQQATIFSLGVMPYISASIIFSLLAKVVPALERIAKEGPSGQRKINQYTRLATVPICFLQSFFVIFGVLAPGGTDSMLHAGVESYYLLYVILVMVALTAGTMFVMWLGEQITEHGVGNGISLIIMAGIIAQLWTAFSPFVTPGSKSALDTASYQNLLLFLFAWVVAVVGVVYMTKAQRRIPIQQAKQTRGRRVYGGQRHFLPLKVNHAGVMPIIFASALLVIPSIFGTAVGWNWLQDAFTRGTGFVYVLTFSALIFFFQFFWTSLMFQPNEMAEQLKEYGSFIPGIRPGKKTAEFLEQTMIRISLAGAAFLSLVAIFPSLVSGQFQGLDQTLIYFMSGTSILIVVGVALDLVEKLNGMLIMRNYEGFMKDSGAAGGAGWGRQGR